MARDFRHMPTNPKRHKAHKAPCGTNSKDCRRFNNNVLAAYGSKVLDGWRPQAGYQINASLSRYHGCKHKERANG
jgi:hypothetical protein